LLDKLRENGSLDNTIIVYISDHGDLIGNHGLWWKANYYEEALRVPFLISGPGLPKGISRNDLVGLIDLFPTLCSLTGTESKCDFDGLDLSPRLCTPSDNEKILRNYIMSEFYGMAIISRKIDNDWEKGSAMRTIISDKFKYVNIIDGNDIMFDLKKDPREFTNVIDDPQYAEEAKGLKAILNKDFSWDKTIERIKKDNERALKLMSGVKPSTPNQYMLPDGRIFDAEESLYNARWLKTDLYGASGIIPQKFG
jgi:choline-sulfatase